MGCGMRALFKNFRFWKLIYCERGATAVEYGFLLALITLAMIVALSNLGMRTTSKWNNIATAVNTH